MLKTIEDRILAKIKKSKRGTLFFNENFICYGTSEAIRRTLARLVEKGEIVRLTGGLYVRPEIDKIKGKVLPGIDDIAAAFAQRDKAKIVPTGNYVLNKLGLSTQEPEVFEYLTNGTTRNIRIGNCAISLVRASQKNVDAIGKISRLVIQALKTIGKENISQTQIEQIQDILSKEKISYLEHDLRVAPVWIEKIFWQTIHKLKEKEGLR
ncbi:MAG: type IV toxin-antitoxin system AbiEi family antitoxin domain-containing protein [Bacteroidales bacterium]|jgi:hypothetical protein|nr:type IV toxin-antitoxin system AbiEi family antitoxin domain-containing protein [Bacteroidales bacterium]